MQYWDCSSYKQGFLDFRIFDLSNIVDFLKIVVTHNGISGDNDLELATWNLLLEETDGDALTTAEANNIIANLYVYNDDSFSQKTFYSLKGDTKFVHMNDFMKFTYIQ